MALARTRVISQYRNSPKLLATLDAIVEDLQGAEDTLTQIGPLDDPAIATGVNLDVTADLVGQQRLLVNGDIANDAMLQLLVAARIFRNSSHGYDWEIIQALSIIFGVHIILISSEGMAMFVSIARVPTTDEIAVLKGDILPRPEGVKLFTQYHQANNFGFDDTPGATTFSENGGASVGTGFAEVF
ncbi:MAG TPA: DUF2612 domain-containing protein [Terriglobia bacterium]|nr:DUF2612 domain-containing protein [Terriglobia bacterium]